MSDRGPSTISTGLAWKTGRGLRQPERAQRVEAPHEVGRDGLEAERAVDAQARPQLIRLEHLVGVAR